MANLWSRVMYAINQGLTAFTTYKDEPFIPDERYGWDTFNSRLMRYQLAQDYYNNTIFTDTIARYSASMREKFGLYHSIRPVYNPVKRLVDWYAGKVYPGALDLQDAEEGAIPLESDNLDELQAIIALWKASRWNAHKSIFVRHGAMLGDTMLKVVDDIQRQQVRLEVLDPRKVIHSQADEIGNLTECIIQYILDDPDEVDSTGRPESYVYTEKWTVDRVETYRDGDLYPFHINALGEPVSSWTNEYGFIPIFHAQHTNLGLQWGANAFHASVRKINELNDAASITNDGARKQVNFPTHAKNWRTGADASQNTVSTKDGQLWIYTGADTEIIPLPPNISIAENLQNIQAMLDEIERDHPELVLAGVNDVTPATATEARQRAESARAKMMEAQPNYDNTLIEAHKSALAIGGYRGYAGFEGFSLDSRINGDLMHDIKQREIVEEFISKERKAELMLQAADSAAFAVVAKWLGASDAEIEDIRAAKEENRRFFVNSMQAQPGDDAPPGDPDATPQEEQQADEAATITPQDIAAAQADEAA